MRAWAILMMLQGHFVDGLLDTAFRDPNSMVYTVWKYFRGITAPVFFTVSGFIFTFLLIQNPLKGLENPRVVKGVKRGLQLLFIGYLLRFNLFGIFKGELYDSFYLVDVLHCIGLSILGIIAVYLLTLKRKGFKFPAALLAITLMLFLLEPIYKFWDFGFLPDALANYFSKVNGSVFTINPWLGYASFGAFLAVLFARYREHRLLYQAAVPMAAGSGIVLLLLSSPFFLTLSQWSGIRLFADIYFNNYLFIRLGDVLLIFAIFMVFRKFMEHQIVLRLGQNTLSIYVIHFILLYGSFTGIGFYYFFEHSLSPYFAIPGAVAFMVLCSYLAFQYAKQEETIKATLVKIPRLLQDTAEPVASNMQRLAKSAIARLLRIFGLVKIK